MTINPNTSANILKTSIRGLKSDIQSGSLRLGCASSAVMSDFRGIKTSTNVRTIVNANETTPKELNTIGIQ